MKRRYILDDATGRLVEVSTDYVPRPRVHIVSDHHAPFRSMATGRMHDSKSAYRAELRERGMVEVGNEKTEIMRQPELKVVDARPELYQTASEMGISL